MVMERSATEAVLEQPAAPTCRHYWIIEPATGRVSRGECQVCHDVKDFENSVGEMERD